MQKLNDILARFSVVPPKDFAYFEGMSASSPPSPPDSPQDSRQDSRQDSPQDSRQDSIVPLFKRLWHVWGRQELRGLLLAFFFMAVVAVLSGAYPTMIQHVFNALSAENPHVIWQMPPLIIGVALIRGIAMYGVARQMSVLSLRVMLRIQKTLVTHLIFADLRLLMASPAGHFVSRLTHDVHIIRDVLVRMANNLVRDGLTVLVLLGVMMWFDWLLTLLVLLIYPLAMGPILAIGRRQHRLSRQLQEQTGETTALLHESIKGGRMIRAYGLEAYEQSRSTKMLTWLLQSQRELALGRARIAPLLEALAGVVMAVIVGLAGWRVLSGAVDVGDIAGFISALLMLVQPVRALGTLNTIVQEAGAALIRLYTLLDTPPAVVSPPEPLMLKDIKGRLDFEDVNFRYDQALTLTDVSFSVEPGQILALVGASGSGKSTIINLIPRLYDPSSGVIRFDGHDLRALDITQLRASIALVSQDSLMFNDSVRANIAFGRLDADEAEIIAAAKAAAAHEFIMELEDGYDTMLGEEGNRLSGGQRQRIAIARAILRDAPILLLDEPTSALDAVTEKQIQAAIKTLSVGRTTLIVAHRLITVQHAEQILVIDQGRVVEAGNHKELLEKGGLYAELCRSQHFY